MRLVKDIISIHTNTPLDRFLGQQAQVLNREEIRVSHSVHVDYLDIAFTETTLPEEHACLYLFPIDDNQFCLQLLYLQHDESKAYTAHVSWIQFLPAFFDQYPAESLMANSPFRFDQTTEQQFTICAQTRSLLTQLQQATGLTDFLQSLQQTELSLHLLRRSLESIAVPFTVCQVPACRFLAYETERDKIGEAKMILDTRFDQPITIKELSRKVAMNECYLKKGFKALTGKTIHEYQQELRISKAKELLKGQEHSVSDVANLLGFSSISHFSTAFKKATGLKPCELLA
ncbi:helix-turn-helix transcriptional regulator [Taibaiella soli]|nr:AraC family transcriptional regulator [Taibaiella soli]